VNEGIAPWLEVRISENTAPRERGRLVALSNASIASFGCPFAGAFATRRAIVQSSDCLFESRRWHSEQAAIGRAQIEDKIYPTGYREGPERQCGQRCRVGAGEHAETQNSNDDHTTTTIKSEYGTGLAAN
jgi:hypothetical protein